MHTKMDNNPIHVLVIIKKTMKGYKKAPKIYQNLSQGEKEKSVNMVQRNIKIC